MKEDLSKAMYAFNHFQRYVINSFLIYLFLDPRSSSVGKSGHFTGMRFLSMFAVFVGIFGIKGL